jgi:hypothetical protein
MQKPKQFFIADQVKAWLPQPIDLASSYFDLDIAQKLSTSIPLNGR